MKATRRFLSPDLSRMRIARADGDDSPGTLVHYAAVFFQEDDPGTEYRLWSDVYERIMPGAFNAAIAEGDDARGLENHNPDRLLGRVGSGTVVLSVDDVGLLSEITLPNTSCGRDLCALVDRGDVPGSSFAFGTHSSMAKRGKVVWVQETRDGETVDVREIHDLELFDVSTATYPAYTATGEPVLRSDGTLVRSESLDQLAQIHEERRTWRREAGLPELPTFEALTAGCSPPPSGPDEVELAARVAEINLGRGHRLR